MAAEARSSRSPSVKTCANCDESTFLGYKCDLCFKCLSRFNEPDGSFDGLADGSNGNWVSTDLGQDIKMGNSLKNEDLKPSILLTEANYRILQPVVYASRIFGLCPIIFKKVGNYYQIKYSFSLVFYSYTILIIFGIATILGLRRDIDAGVDAIRLKNSKTRYITLCDIAMVFVIALYGVVSIPYRMRRFFRLLDIWSNIDKVIPITDYKKYRRYSIMLITGVLATTTSIYMFDVFMYCRQWHISNNPTFYIQNYICYYMLYFMMVFQEIFFWHLVFFIHTRLKNLNEHLTKEKSAHLKHNNLKKIFCGPYTLNCLVKNEEKLVEDNHRTATNMVKSAVTIIEQNTRTAEKVADLIIAYGKIRDSVEFLNDSASNGIVLIILSCLVHLVVTPYFLLVEIFRPAPSGVFIVLQSVWFLSHIGRLLIIIEPCQTCLKEYKITNNLISEMILLDFDKDTKKLLRNFATQFSYATISFNACGFFSIERRLLTSVAGAVSTYLVILFQFNGHVSSQ